MANDVTITARELQAAVFLISEGVLNAPSKPDTRTASTAIAGALGMYLASGLSLENWLWSRGVDVDDLLRAGNVTRLVDLLAESE